MGKIILQREKIGSCPDSEFEANALQMMKQN